MVCNKRNFYFCLKSFRILCFIFSTTRNRYHILHYYVLLNFFPVHRFFYSFSLSIHRNTSTALLHHCIKHYRCSIFQRQPTHQIHHVCMYLICDPIYLSICPPVYPLHPSTFPSLAKQMSISPQTGNKPLRGTRKSGKFY